MTARRAPALGIVLGSQIVGAGLALLVAIAFGEPFPAPNDLLVAVGGAGFAVVGILFLYQGLAVGRMSIVAPVTGVLAAAIPVAVGSAVDGLPGALVLVGFAVAVVSVALVSRPTTDEHGTESGLRLAVISGIGLGTFSVFLGGLSEGLIAGPLVAIRFVEALILVTVIAVSGRPWRVARPLWRWVALIGVLDMGGNVFFIGSIQTYRLDVAAALSSLYPVVTVILAAILMRERITGLRGLGIGLAALSIALIASNA
jgi:drug/metabolite transporter (DMT)-like permease